jgi:glycosyltransferase involved in cell wall biosynthesis
VSVDTPVTVVIPCFNYGRFVRAAVRSALEQRGADVRVVVVNDGSTDRRSARDCDACRGERVEVIHQENRGLPAARNRGAAGAATEFLLFLDADDTLEPTCVRDLAEAIREEDAAGRGGDVSHAYGQQRILMRGSEFLWRVPAWDPDLLMITNLHPPTALVWTSAFAAVRGFDESMREGYEDWDFWLRLAEHGFRGVRVQKPTYTWRRHSATTMISGAVQKHEAIYRRIVANHPKLFGERGDEALLRMNVLLRRHDMNWLDESLEPIPLVKLKAQRERYEAMPAVRVHHAIHRAIVALPRPAASVARKGLSGVKRLLVRGG